MTECAYNSIKSYYVGQLSFLLAVPIFYVFLPNSTQFSSQICYSTQLGVFNVLVVYMCYITCTKSLVLKTVHSKKINVEVQHSSTFSCYVTLFYTQGFGSVRFLL